MTVTQAPSQALASTVPDPARIAKYMPDARLLAGRRAEIPSIRTIQRFVVKDFYLARDVVAALVAEDPNAPVSSGAPTYPTIDEATAAYPALNGPRPATIAGPVPAKRSIGALILPLLLVNAAAVYGQAGWAYDHLGRSRIVAALFAAAVESIGIYLAAEAHSALMAGDASARLRLGSYLVGALVGGLNYAHFASTGYTPNPTALTFGLLSSISPWLWSIRSRSLNRDRLRELDQIDPRAVRFSVLRWVLFPVRTPKAFRRAVWTGTVSPAEAIAAADAARAARPPKGGRRFRRPATTDVPASEPAE